MLVVTRDGRHPAWRLLGALAVAALLASGCAAHADTPAPAEHAQAVRLANENAELRTRVTDLQRQLGDLIRFRENEALGYPVVRQTVALVPASGPAGTHALDLCVQYFAHGDLNVADSPRSLAEICRTVPLDPAAPDTKAQLLAVLDDPVFQCWSAAAPASDLPACWR